MPKKSVLAIGGCHWAYLLSQMGSHFDGKLLWRTSIPSLMSPQLDMRGVDFGAEEINKVLRREVEKKARATLERNEAKIIAFDTVSDFVTRRILLSGSVFVDFRNGIFGEKFADISFDAFREFDGYQSVEADAPIFRELFRASFDDLYRASLRRKIEASVKVVFLCQDICNFHLSVGEMVPWGGEWVGERQDDASKPTWKRSYPAMMA